MPELNETEMFRAVLNEILNEHKQFSNAIKEMNKTVAGLGERMDGFQRQLENLQIVAPPPDLQPLKDQFAAGVADFGVQVKETLAGMQAVHSQQLQKMTAVLEAQPKPIVRRISLFPENDRHGNFKYFFKCLFLSILGFGLLAGLYAFGAQWLEQRGSRQPPVRERSVSFPESSLEAPAHKPSGRHSTKRVRPQGANISKDTTIPRGDSFASSSP
ncbi:hypothetical protein Q4E93_32555 [Flavitalea sp. BT771]|uniref:hypothetical protein n=1 Tax=Flavitalea sp. BT771 TaxID=3063329 RepID=UPI0026E26A2E|nr:hypothetical protein [Flavitalea sp. BT771]MDO6435393.1 hypothetical protein [Flavitalea sp. BT771]MDV6224247.1 hypothetical protein [Flavitalea sp. BT771]